MARGAPSRMEEALAAVGELLASEGVEIGIVILGGTALNMLGIVERTTLDVDVLAITMRSAGKRPPSLTPPEPLPEPLRRAVAKVGRDFGLPEDWVDTAMGLQWKTGLPSGLEKRVHWKRFGGLGVGVVDRYDLIFFKLFAAADSGGPSSVHYQDLIALRPSKEEVEAAAQWARGQDPSPGFSRILHQVIGQVREDVG